MDTGSGGGTRLVAALSEAGQEFIFAHGRAAFWKQLVKTCVADSDQAAISAIEWVFVDDAILGNENSNDQLQALLLSHKKPSLPDILARKLSGEGVEYLFEIPAELTWFDGHFPGDPILPAVVQVDWAIHFGQQLGFDPDRFSGFARLKFMAVIQPGMLVKSRLAAKGEALQFAYLSAAGPLSKGTVKFFTECADE